MTRPVLEAALAAEFDDFEDAVLHEAAIFHEARGIVTRNGKGVTKARIPIYSPD